VNPLIRETVEYMLERLDMQDGEPAGIEVFVSSEGRTVWGLLPADLHEAIVQLHSLILEESGDEEE
jgi:hypothetical protein